jgi:hypothetical protein
MRFVPIFASGLETRNHFQNRQEKNEFYFHCREEFFLTKKPERACPRKIKMIIILRGFGTPRGRL